MIGEFIHKVIKCYQIWCLWLSSCCWD